MGAFLRFWVLLCKAYNTKFERSVRIIILFTHTSLTFLFPNISLFHTKKARCEAILRSNPDSRNTKELHLACIEGVEEMKEKQIKKAAVESTIGVAAVGLVLGVAGMLLKRR